MSAQQPFYSRPEQVMMRGQSENCIQTADTPTVTMVACTMMPRVQ